MNFSILGVFSILFFRMQGFFCLQFAKLPASSGAFYLQLTISKPFFTWAQVELVLLTRFYGFLENLAVGAFLLTVGNFLVATIRAD